MQPEALWLKPSGSSFEAFPGRVFLESLSPRAPSCALGGPTLAAVAAGGVEFEGCADASDCPALYECLPLSAGPDSGEISFDSVGPAMATLMRVFSAACMLPPFFVVQNYPCAQLRPLLRCGLHLSIFAYC